MKRSSAIVTLLAGILLLFGSCAPLGYSLYQNLLSTPVATIPLVIGESARSVTVKVATGKLARIAVKGSVETDSVQEDHSGTDTTYRARFRFPVDYSVTDSTGSEIISAHTELVWNGGSITRTAESVDSLGGRLTVQSNFDKFATPASGEINVVIAVAADSSYGAGISALELLVYDGLAPDIWYVITGIAMLVIGIILAILGFVFFLTTTVAARTDPIAEMPATDSGAAPVTELSRQRAIWVHLSGFLGYFIPLGNLIGPLVLWLTWRDADEFVNEAGREALNFQLTVMIYVIISLLLAIILIGFLLLTAVAIYQLAYMILAAVQNSKGERFRYPLIFRFIK